MRSLESLQRAVRTTADLHAIVRTMKVLAAVSIRQYERAVASLHHYTRTVDLGVQALVRANPNLLMRFSSSSETRTGMIVIGSDYGLCGRFNENVTRFAVEAMRRHNRPLDGAPVLSIGVRTSTLLEARGVRVEECFLTPSSVAGINASVRQVLLKIDEWKGRGVDDVLLFYNRHRGGTASEPTMFDLLAFDATHYAALRRQPWPSRSLPLHTLPERQLLSALLRESLFISIFRASAESLASEHASRLLSMQVAERNIEQQMERLAAEFQQQRQNAITDELLDVVAGFGALKENER